MTDYPSSYLYQDSSYDSSCDDDDHSIDYIHFESSRLRFRSPSIESFASYASLPEIAPPVDEYVTPKKAIVATALSVRPSRWLSVLLGVFLGLACTIQLPSASLVHGQDDFSRSLPIESPSDTPTIQQDLVQPYPTHERLGGGASPQSLALLPPRSNFPISSGESYPSPFLSETQDFASSSCSCQSSEVVVASEAPKPLFADFGTKTMRAVASEVGTSVAVWFLFGSVFPWLRAGVEAGLRSRRGLGRFRKIFSGRRPLTKAKSATAKAIKWIRKLYQERSNYSILSDYTFVAEIEDDKITNVEKATTDSIINAQ